MEEPKMKKALTIAELAETMRGGESRYLPGKSITYLGPVTVELTDDTEYEYYAEWDLPPDEFFCQDGEITTEGEILMENIDDEQLNKAYKAYLEGYADYLNVDGVPEDWTLGKDIAE